MIEQEMIGHRTTAEAFVNAKADDTEYLEYIGGLCDSMYVFAWSTHSHSFSTERDGEMEEKFWEITRAGASTRVRYGPIGAEGFVLVKDHSDEPSAAKFMADKVREKLEKVGYHRSVRSRGFRTVCQTLTCLLPGWILTTLVTNTIKPSEIIRGPAPLLRLKML